MKLISTRKDIYIVISIIIYRLLLDCNFFKIIEPVFGYAGFEGYTNVKDYLMSWLYFLLLLPLIKRTFNKEDISSHIIILLTLVTFIPFTSLTAFMSYENTFIFLNLLYWLILLCLNLYLPLINIKVPNAKTTNAFFWGILSILSITIIYISGVYTQFRFSFSLDTVYDLRMEEREFDMPIILSYLSSAANTLLPLFLIYFLNNKNKIMTILLSVIILLNFGIGGHKLVIFMFLLCFLGYWFFRLKMLKYYGWIFASICAITLIEYLVFNKFIITNLTTFRMFYIPAQINYWYYDFFTTNEFDYFRQGMLRWIGFESPYRTNLAFLIGDLYMGSESTRANNGLFTDAYMNLGTIGVITFPFIVVMIIRYIDACTVGLSERFVFLPIMVTMLSLLSTTFSTALVTSGLILMMLTLYFLPRTTVYPKLD